MIQLMEMAKTAVISYRTATSSLRLSPDFIIIGTARSGTTSLYNYLVRHPNVAPALMKEVHFFDCHYQKGISWYHSQFPSIPYKYYTETIRRRTLITGEASPYYMFHPYVPERMAALLPNVKLIALLRNPVERVFSHYCWEVGWGNEKFSLEEAIEHEEKRIRVDMKKLATGDSFNHRHFSYLARSMYVDQLERWLQYFPRKQLLLIKSEELYAEPERIFKETLAFLHLPNDAKILNNRYKQYNKQKYPVPQQMAPETRRRLVEIFMSPNERLYKLVDRNFGWQ
ncbi:MAG: sulfotransferase domain-containing protein [Chloroflexi bacterium]|nr:MAG: sulfotransferase domain-containing protein [Chloroflexota bacterium]